MTEREYNAQLCEEKHKNLEVRIFEQGECLSTLTDMLHELKEQTGVLKSMWKTSLERQETQAKQIDELQKKPSAMWDKAVTALITALIVGAVNLVVYLK